MNMWRWSVAFALTGMAFAAASTVAGARATAAPINYACDLSPEEESHEVESPGKGRASFTLDRDTLALQWMVTYQGLTGVAESVGLYGPDRPGATAGLIIDLAPGATRSPVKGSRILSDGELQYLVTGRMYVNIMTPKYKDGEVRCQVTRLRDQPPATQ